MLATYVFSYIKMKVPATIHNMLCDGLPWNSLKTPCIITTTVTAKAGPTSMASTVLAIPVLSSSL